VPNACALFERNRANKAAMQCIEANAIECFRTPAFLALSEAALGSILDSNRLNITEPAIVQACVRWAGAECKRRGLDASPATFRDTVLKSILPRVRFPIMTSAELAKYVSPTQLVSGEQLIAIYTYLNSSADMRSKSSIEYLTTPRVPESCLITFTDDAKTSNGCIHYAGTQRRTAAWRNPVITGDVTIKVSSQQKWNTVPLLAAQAAELSQQFFVSKRARHKRPPIWIHVDFGAFQVQPVGYAFQTHNGMQPGSWTLRGSNDASQWTLLDRQENYVFNANNGQGGGGANRMREHFPIANNNNNNNNNNDAKQIAYRYFSFVCTRTRSHNHQIAMRGLEIFGTYSKRR
jgi:hypothetical protein